MKDHHILQDALSGLREDVILIRLCRQGLMEDAKCCQTEEMRCLQR